MSGQKRQARKRAVAAGLLAELAVQQQQIDSAIQPALSIRTLLGESPDSQRVIGRPWFVWRDNPEIARLVNDGLSPHPAV